MESSQVSRLVNRSPVFYGWVIMAAGMLGLVSQHVMNQWWVRRRGVIMGISH